MAVAMRRLVSLVSILALSAFGTASAQVTIHLTTAQQTSCDITTDANGLRLVPGSADLMATGVTLSGTGCGGGGAPTPNNFPLTPNPASPTAGTPFTVSWSVSGATSCTGSASFNGSSTSLSGWTDVTAATSPRTVTASAAGSYTLSLTCSNTSGSITSTPLNLVVQGGSGGGDVCPSSPRTRATVSDIHYLPEPPTHVRHNVDLTLWDNIWGHVSETDNVTPWPGPSGATPTISTLGKTQYIAAKFHVGASPPSVFGFYKNVSYGAGPNLDVSISTNCGDFTPSQQTCVATNKPANDAGMLYWSLTNPVYCKLEPNTDYYFNVQFHDPNTSGPGCSGGTCRTTIGHVR
jgi:hypothetical protein